MRIVVPAFVLLLVFPSVSPAWGFEAHRFIAAEMIKLLPAEIRPLFEKREAFIVERSVDPDYWRNIFGDEAPNHFLDMDHFGAYPFDALPREYDQAVQQFGREVVHEQGLLPWRTAEVFGHLRREFERLTRDNAPAYVPDNIAFYAAVLAHYVGDGHVPLHSVVNYDGQLTRQHGLHGRWESELFDRTRTRVKVAPAAATPASDPRGVMFDTLLASNRLVAGVLEADRQAAAGREFYDDGYFEAFAKAQFPVLERRLNESMTAVAALIAGAWDAAGRPALPPDRPRSPRPIPRPRG